MAKKFIIQGDQLRIGHVELHRELKGKEGEIKGGGYWELNKDKDTLYLYGSSVDFGKCTVEDIKNSRENGFSGSIDSMDWKFSLSDSLKDCFDNPDLKLYE